jgi:ferredoxin
LSISTRGILSRAGTRPRRTRLTPKAARSKFATFGDHLGARRAEHPTHLVRMEEHEKGQRHIRAEGEERRDRYRHRFYRKWAYLFGKLDEPACVGCGRCSSVCLPDIADPVKVFNSL